MDCVPVDGGVRAFGKIILVRGLDDVHCSPIHWEKRCGSGNSAVCVVRGRGATVRRSAEPGRRTRAESEVFMCFSAEAGFPGRRPLPTAWNFLHLGGNPETTGRFRLVVVFLAYNKSPRELSGLGIHHHDADLVDFFCFSTYFSPWRSGRSGSHSVSPSWKIGRKVKYFLLRLRFSGWR